MDQSPNPASAPPATPQAPPPPPPGPPPACPKCGSSWLAIIIAAILGAAIAGLLVYIIITKFFNFMPPTVGGCDDKLVMSQNALVECEAEVLELESENEELVALTEESTETTEAEIPSETTSTSSEYAGWSSYTDSVFGFTWQHPSNWLVKENVMLADENSVMEKTGFCLSFSPTTTDITATTTTLSVCYRDQGDSGATTWFRTGMGYGELAKVPISIDMGGHTITEKTLFGEDGNITDIIYSQNETDDETGLPGRVAIGNYYFSMIVSNDYGIFIDAEGITTEDQETIDLILASLQM